MAYHDSPSKITVGETISSTSKLFSTGPETIHSKECPNFVSTDHYKSYHTPAHHYDRRDKRENLKPKYFSSSKSGFEELDYLIAKNTERVEYKGKLRKNLNILIKIIVYNG